MFQKLRDPDGLVSPQKLKELDKKLSSCLTGLYRKPTAGGNPFLFSLTITKPHVLSADRSYAQKRGEETGKIVPGTMMCPTAATDGRSFFWHPDFLEALTIEEVPTVMEHEQYHILFDHVHRMPYASYLPKAYAIDYVVNSCIETNHKNLQRRGTLWGGNLGNPIPLKELLDFIDGLLELDSPKTKVRQPPGSGPIMEVDLEESEPRIFADVTLFGRSPESIYDEIFSHWEKSPRLCRTCGALSLDPKTGKPKASLDPKTGKPRVKPCPNRPSCEHAGMCCPSCGTELRAGPNGDGVPMDIPGLPNPMDGHIKPTVSKQEVQAELMKAAQNTRAMRGMVPSEIEGLLGELSKPVITWTDIMFSDCLRKSRDSGLRNDWSRPRKRWLSADPSQYLPDRHDHMMTWLMLLDTSGSMSDADVAFVVSQCQVLTARGTEGIIVPVDATAHWEAATTVKGLKDLKFTKVVGRGGTVFEDFFRDFPKRLGTDFDSIGILTDGDCGDIPKKLRPPIPVNWILTRPKPGFAPTFGRVVPMRHERM